MSIEMGACVQTAFLKERRFTSNPLLSIEHKSGCPLAVFFFVIFLKSNFLGTDLTLTQATPDWYKQELHIIYNYSGCKGYMPYQKQRYIL